MGVSEGLEYSTNVLLMFLEILGPYDDIVKMNMADFSNEVLKSCAHATLVCCRGVTKSLGHYHPFVHPEWSGYRSVFDMFGIDLHLEEHICHVDLAPDFSFRTVSENVTDFVERMLVWCGDVVEFTVVVDPALGCGGVYLGDYKGWGNEWTFGGTHATCREVVLEEFEPGSTIFLGTGICVIFDCCF